MMEASLKNKVEDYLFTSSVGVYAQKEILKEEDVVNFSLRMIDLLVGLKEFVNYKHNVMK